MKLLKFLSDFFLGSYITTVIYWSILHHPSRIRIILLLIAGLSFYFTLNFVISSLREHERRPALMSAIVLGSLTLALFLGAYLTI